MIRRKVTFRVEGKLIMTRLYENVQYADTDAAQWERADDDNTAEIYAHNSKAEWVMLEKK